MTYRRPPTVVCPCGQPIGNNRAASGMKRCTWCVDRFARSTPPAQPPPQMPLLKSEAQRPSATNAPPAAAPAAPVRPDPSVVTREQARRLDLSRRRAAGDPRGLRLLELRKLGVSFESALEQVEHEFSLPDAHERPRQ